MGIEKPKIVIILGPTAVGKTDLSLGLAETFGGEIISADSMQVYRHLDIRSSKPLPQERERVPHHLIDVVNPDEGFSAARFNETAGGVIRGLEGKKAVFVVGGTGLYVRALTGGLIDGLTRISGRATARRWSGKIANACTAGSGSSIPWQPSESTLATRSGSSGRWRRPS